MKAIVLITMLFVASATAFSQTAASPVGLIDTDRLGAQGGIERLVAATSLMGMQHFCQQCSKLQSAIKNLENEISQLRCFGQNVADPEARLVALKGEYDAAVVTGKEQYDKTVKLLINPIVEDIRLMAKKFAAERKYVALVNKTSSIFDSPIITTDDESPVVDVTREFIQFCNSEFERLKRNQ
jgi:TolA-binding protein